MVTACDSFQQGPQLRHLTVSLPSSLAPLQVILFTFPQRGHVFPCTSKASQASHLDLFPWLRELPPSCRRLSANKLPAVLPAPRWSSIPLLREPGLALLSVCSALSTPLAFVGTPCHSRHPLPFLSVFQDYNDVSAILGIKHKKVPETPQ